MRLNSASITRAVVLIASVLAKPGTPSISTCPRARRATRIRSSMRSWPTMTFLISTKTLRIVVDACWKLSTGIFILRSSCQCWLASYTGLFGRSTTGDNTGHAAWSPQAWGTCASAQLVGSPPPPVPRQQLIRLLGSRRTRRVVRKLLRRVLLPVPPERGDDGPPEVPLLPAPGRGPHAPAGVPEEEV